MISRQEALRKRWLNRLAGCRDVRPREDGPWAHWFGDPGDPAVAARVALEREAAAQASLEWEVCHHLLFATVPDMFAVSYRQYRAAKSLEALHDAIKRYLKDEDE